MGVYNKMIYTRIISLNLTDRYNNFGFLLKKYRNTRTVGLRQSDLMWWSAGPDVETKSLPVQYQNLKHQ